MTIASNIVNKRVGLQVIAVVLLVAALFAFWVAFNALFMLPGRYSAINFVIAGMGISSGGLLSLLSKRLLRSRAEEHAVAATKFPTAICLVLIFACCAIALIAIAMRN
jgi:hypothetical protein